MKSEYLLRHVRSSVRLRVTTRLALNGFWRNLIFKLFFLTRRFHTHTHTHTTVAQQTNSWLGRLIAKVSRSTQTHTHTPGRTPLNKWSARRRGRYLHKPRTSMPLAGFKPAIPATKQLQIYALELNAAGIDVHILVHFTDTLLLLSCIEMFKPPITQSHPKVIQRKKNNLPCIIGNVQG